MEYVKKVVGMSSEVSDSVLVGYYETFDAVEKVFPRLDPGRQTVSLPWNTAVQSCRACEALLESKNGVERAIDFVDTFLYEVVNVLLIQCPTVQKQEQTSIDVSCNIAMNIVLKLASSFPEVFVRNYNIAACLMSNNENHKYFYGTKVNWKFHQGFLKKRNDLVRKFCEGGGFESFLHLIIEPKVWIGTDNLYNFLHNFHEVNKVKWVSQNLCDAVVRGFMAQLLELPDNEIKKDTHSHAICVDMIPLINTSKDIDVNSFRLEHTLKLSNSDAMVLKLSAWDQMGTIVREAIVTRPLAARYVVEGAGNPNVNGVYEYEKDHRDQDGTYSSIYLKHVPQDSDVPELSIIRCKMKENFKKWFISDVDLKNPGTNGDTDYYQQKGRHSQADSYLEREPVLSANDWQSSDATKQVYGVLPAPSITKVGERLDMDMTPERYLVNVIPRWVHEQSLLTHVFGPNIKREIVLRCKTLYCFLAETGNLTVDDVRLAWKAATDTPDNVICEEVHLLLAEAAAKMRSEPFSALVAAALETLNVHSHNLAEVSKIASFVEKFALKEYKCMLYLPPDGISGLMNLIWSVYQNPHFSSLKNKTGVQDILSKCLGMEGGAAITLQRVSECLQSLATLKIDFEEEQAGTGTGMQVVPLVRVSSSRVGESASASANTKAKANNYQYQYQPTSAAVVKATSLVHTLLFLISKHSNKDSIAELAQNGFAGAMVNEIRRFVETNREIHGSDSINNNNSSDDSDSDSVSPHLAWFNLELGNRLRVLSQFFAIHHEIKMSANEVDGLWDLLSINSNSNHSNSTSIPAELEQLFKFLAGGVVDEVDAVYGSKSASIFDDETTESVFEKYICSESLDWSTLGNDAFECFHSYYRYFNTGAGVKPFAEKEKDPRGLKTLWDVMLNCSDGCKDKAMNLLLDSYGASAVYTYSFENKSEEMLEIAFAHLSGAHIESVAMNGTLSPTMALRVSRCVELLSLAISKKPSSGVNSAHATRGCAGRIQVNVRYRKMTSYYNTVQQTNMFRVEKGSSGDGVVDIHPLHTLKELKNKIIGLTGSGFSYSDREKLVFDSYHQYKDTTRLCDAGITDGGSLSIHLKVTTAMSGYPYKDNMNLNMNMAPAAPADTETDYNYDFDNNNVNNHGGAREAKLDMIISSDEARFGTLLTLCDAVSDRAVQSKIWGLMMMIPTQKEMLDTVLTAAKSGEANTDWQALVYGKGYGTDTEERSPARTSYLLQIIDQTLQPAPECPPGPLLETSIGFRSYFVASGGFHDILRVLLSTDTEGGNNGNNGNSKGKGTQGTENAVEQSIFLTALHVLHFLLFPNKSTNKFTNKDTNGGSTGISEGEDEGKIEIVDMEEGQKALHTALQNNAEHLIDNLLRTAGDAIDKDDSMVLRTALDVLGVFFTDSVVHNEKLIQHECSRNVLVVGLRSEAQKVRKMCAAFAVLVGKKEPTVFRWLLKEVADIPFNDKKSQEIFLIVTTLLSDNNANSSSYVDVVALATFISDRLLVYPTMTQEVPGNANANGTVGGDQAVLGGYLQMLEALLKHHASVVRATDLGPELVNLLLHSFLFTLPMPMSVDVDEDKVFKDGNNNNSYGNGTGSNKHKHARVGKPICETPFLRGKAFAVLLSYTAATAEAEAGGRGEGDAQAQAQAIAPLDQIVRAVMGLTNSTKAMIGETLSFSLQVQQDVKTNGITLLGLKNQGCTCYMNSLLQQLFLCKSFRNAILAAPMLESCRTTLWHRSDENLVDEEIEISGALQGEPLWTRFKVLGYDKATKEHVLRVIPKLVQGQNGPPNQNLKETRMSLKRYRESCKIRIPAPEGAAEVSEDDMAAYAILEQLQKTFLYLQGSSRRFYDPRPLVDACKTLNMNFSVYQQNDACEFFDKLLERIETATQGTHTRVNIWKDLMRSQVFGGSFLYEKIPVNSECGHQQDSRVEDAPKVELQIRGKDNVQSTLAEYFTGELMGGENAIKCSVCERKQDTVRRTCLGDLPNTLVLHLKRFDLDFTTFETVKLNNRMEFPQNLNMLQYTKEGFDMEDRRKTQEEAGEGEGGREEVSQSQSDQAPQALQALDIGAGDQVHPSLEQTMSTRSASDLADVAVEVANDPDPADYEYELQGALVHAGVANGGHYYSFARDPDSLEWCRLDDDDVSPFDPDGLPYQCYGGPQGNAGDKDRTSNALILFYNKIRPARQDALDGVNTNDITDTDALIAKLQELALVEIEKDHAEKTAATATASGDTTSSGKGEAENGDGNEFSGSGNGSGEVHAVAVVSEKAKEKEVLVLPPTGRLVTGIEAFETELQTNNLLHVLSCYLLDSDLHGFVCELLGSATATAGQRQTSDEAIWQCTKFYLDVVLHCRDCDLSLSLMWFDAISKAFDNSPCACLHFVRSLTDQDQCPWLYDYFARCTDSGARQAFSKLVQMAVQKVVDRAVAEEGADAVVALSAINAADKTALLALRVQCFPDRGDASPTQVAIAAIAAIVQCVRVAATFPKSGEELFCLVRDMANQPIHRLLLMHHCVISTLAWFIEPTLTAIPPNVKDVLDLASAESTIPRTSSSYSGSGSTMRASMTLTDYYRMLQSVAMEAICAMAGMPQVRKVVLLVDKAGEVNWELEPTPEALIAIHQIFNELSEELKPVSVPKSKGDDLNGAIVIRGITTRTLESYLKRVGSVPNRMKTMLIRYKKHVHVSACGKQLLQWEGFLQHCIEMVGKNELPLWKILHAHGYRNDLTRDPRAIGAAKSLGGSEDPPNQSNAVDIDIDIDTDIDTDADGSGGDSDDETPPPSTQLNGNGNDDVDYNGIGGIGGIDGINRIMGGFLPGPSKKLDVPSPCREVLAQPDLFVLGMDHAEAPTKALAQCVSYEDVELTDALLMDALMRMRRAVCAFESLSAEMACTFIACVLEIQDSLLLHRLDFVLSHPDVGLISQVTQERNNPTKCRANDYHSTGARDRLTEQIAKLCGNPAFLLALKNQAAIDESGVSRSVYGALKLNGNYHSIEEEQRMKTAEITISCGNMEVDGIYKYINTQCNGGVYERRGPHTIFNKQGDQTIVHNARYLIYKCKMQNNSFQWFLSVVPENTDPGTAKDTDLVFAAEDPRMVCYYGRILPPKEFRGFNNSNLVPLMFYWPDEQLNRTSIDSPPKAEKRNTYRQTNIAASSYNMASEPLSCTNMDGSMEIDDSNDSNYPYDDYYNS